ncbi:MAG: alpha/beta hydrolase [Clostridia bacterium]|nr:alpha/beta hydrolase [Clostridia bacterium]
MLLLHGYLSCKESFYYQIKFLSRYFRVTAPDIIGFGASARLEEPYSLDDYCDWLKEFINVSGLEKPHIIAHSFGARLAFKFLSGQKDAADKLVVTGGAGIVKPRSKSYIRHVKAYRRMKKFFPSYAEKHFGSEEYRTLPPVMRESYKKIVNEDLRSFAAAVENKTLLIYGREDKVTPPDCEGKIFNGLIRDSTFALADGGHFCFSENAEAFNKLVYDFLTEN